jgi:hypothetical protein
MTKIEEFFPSHTKRAWNFQRNLGLFLGAKSEVAGYEFYDYHQEQVKKVRSQGRSIKTPKGEVGRIEKKLDKLDVVTAKETITGVMVYSELESFLILLNDDIDEYCKLYGGEPVPTATTISELHEVDLGRWLFHSIYVFTDK